MMNFKTEPPTKVTQLMFVRAYHNLPGISQGEWIEYYHPSALDRLRRDLKSYLQHQLDLFLVSADYGEFFSVAEYDGPRASISDDEFKVFYASLQREDRDPPSDELHPSDTLMGLRAVMLHRVSNGGLDDIRAALQLFDYVMECGIQSDNRSPCSSISLETASDFVPWLIARLLQSVDRLKRTCRLDDYQKFIGEEFEPLKPLLERLQTTVCRPGWPSDDLSLGRALLIVDRFRHVIEERGGF